MNPELSIIIPTLNEQDNILPLVDGLRKVLDGISWEVIFIDDHSRDTTVAVIENLSRKDDKIRLIKRSGQKGLSSACIEGIKQSAGSYIAVMDADLQHDESLLKEMLSALKTEVFDVVIGSRYVENSVIESWSKVRILMSRFATSFTRVVVRIGIKDPLSGFFMIRKGFFEKTSSSLFGKGQKILLDLCLSSSHPVRFKELPYRFKRRTSGRSKLNLRVIWENVLLILNKRFKLKL